MGWWLPLDSPSPIQGAGKRPHLHGIHMQFYYEWQPPTPFGPSPLPTPFRSLFPPAHSRAEWSRDPGGAITHLPRDLILRLPGMGTPGWAQRRTGRGSPRGALARLRERRGGRRCGSLGWEGRGGAGGRKGVGARALAQAGSFDKETGSRGRGDAERPGSEAV